MIGVVGGGLAGLAAAYRLREAGREVRVFEAGDEIGGLARSYETAGDPIEAFYHHLSRAEETILELADGLGVKVEWRVGRTATYADGVVHPLDTPWQILAYPRLSTIDKLHLAALVSEIDVRFDGMVPRVERYGDLEEYDDVPAERFLRERTTDRVYENFWAPLLEAKFGSRAGEVSAAWLLGRVRFRGERDLLRGEILGYPDGGIGVLVDALIDAVGRETIETGARVTCLSPGDAVESLTVERGGKRERHEVDGVIIAAMPSVLESLTGYECGIEFQGTICSVVSAEQSLTDTYWLNLADETPFGLFVEHTNFIPPERYGGEHLYYLASYVQNPDEELWGLSNREVERRWLRGVADLFPEFDPESTNWVRTARNPQTAPIYDLGYLDRVVPYDLAEEVADGVYYAGMASRAQYPERSLNGAIEAGFACADRILGH
ncbi:NAD(P)/FAD-dependent oxidoreductase [Saliphagus infecundisoli]|uniref:NAD(P)/FAD-dependent oxidoreductase n=1 Tax=Saliphagus infecundisoli TaxID=1849069 RepID=A0ABD5QFQ0_9EURY|nr:NAD(P)/FAD-dependent oxidoreductase [Saliphagus infecundisoli]